MSLATTYLFERPDAVGAFPIHAILVCNTPESLRASFACLEANPRLLLQVHEYSGPFAGETALHIMCANRREDEACRMIDLALAFLDETEVAFLLRNRWKLSASRAMPRNNNNNNNNNVRL